jgi:hypothetical protein
MKITRLFAVLGVVFALSELSASAQFYEYQFIFHGTAYTTNAAGVIVATPITDQTLLADRAHAGGITDLSTVTIAYHINGDPKGDTVEILSTNGTKLAFEFGLWFGSDPSLGRSALTDGTQTEVRRVDPIYTLENSTYTHSNPDSVGSAFVTKHFLTDTNGNTNSVIEGTISWGVVPQTLPQSTNGTIMCIGNFTLGRPLF